MTKDRLIEIPMHEIDGKDKTFCLSFPVAVYPLASLIEETGYIYPLLLRKTKKKYQVISGFKRLEIFKGKKKMIPAFVFTRKELSDRKAILLSFYENLAGRHFNAAEKSMAFEKLRSLGKIKDEELISRFLPLTGLPAGKKCLEDYLSLSVLEPAVKRELAEGKISVETGVILAGLPALERKYFLKLIKKIYLNQNKAKIIATLIKEISRREHRPVLSLFKEELIKDSRSFSDLRDYLFSRRYPEVKKYEREFLNLVKNLKLPAGIEILPPPFFERDRFKMNIEIKEEGELQKILLTLQRAFETQEFKKLISML